MTAQPCILTIAGSDSGGGAGIQADLKTMAMLGGFGMSVITALTAQNSMGVTGIHAPEPDFVGQQLDAVLSDFPVAAAKTGMLFSGPIIAAVCDRLATRTFPLVVDPVCVSQSGHRLLQEEAVDVIRQRLIPLADVFTPNRPEAELLAGMTIETEQDIHRAIERLQEMGAKAVLLKGGHFEGERMVDWLGIPGEAPVALEQPKIETNHTHGTGCTLSSAIATGLGKGFGVRDAVTAAQQYLNSALAAGFGPGEGYGPPNHSIPLLRLQDRERCRQDMRAALAALKGGAGLRHLLGEGCMNIACSTVHARCVEDVCAVSGGVLADPAGRALVAGAPEFGVSQRMTGILAAAQAVRPSMRACVCMPRSAPLAQAIAASGIPAFEEVQDSGQSPDAARAAARARLQERLSVLEAAPPALVVASREGQGEGGTVCILATTLHNAMKCLDTLVATGQKS